MRKVERYSQRKKEGKKECRSSDEPTRKAGMELGRGGPPSIGSELSFRSRTEDDCRGYTPR